MGTVNINLAEAQNLNLPLGLQLENEVTEVVFDFSAWKTAYGSGDLGLSIQRPGDSQPYAGELTIDGTDATWTVSSLDIAYKGVGEIQLTYTVGTVVKKSVIYKFTVYKSLGANGEYPSPGQTWQEGIEDDIEGLRTDVDADHDELIDIREGADGVTYPSAGDAVRGQITDLKADLSSVKLGTMGVSIPVVVASDWIKGGVSSTTGKEDFDSAKLIHTHNIYAIEDDSDYTFTGVKITGRAYYNYFYDENGAYIGRSNSAIPLGARFVRFCYGFTSGASDTVDSYGMSNLIADWGVEIVPPLYKIVNSGIYPQGTLPSDADLNTYTNNGIWVCASTTNMTNAPYNPVSGILIVNANDSNYVVQSIICVDKHIRTRLKYNGSWSAWVDRLPYGVAVTSSNYSTMGVTDALTMDDGITFFNATVTSAMVANLPVYGVAQTIIKYGAVAGTSNGGILIDITRDNRAFFGMQYSSEISWQQITSESYVASKIKDNTKQSILLSAFKRFAVIGDSMAAGHLYPNASSSANGYDDKSYSWATYITRFINNTVYNFSQHGHSPDTFISGILDGVSTGDNSLSCVLDGNHDVPLYIVALSLNNHNNLSEGSTDDIDLSDYTQNANTRYGTTAGLIQRISKYYANKGTMTHIVMIAPTHWGGFTQRQNHDRTVEVYEYIKSTIEDDGNGLYLIDLWDEPFYDSAFISGNTIQNHYSAMGYNASAMDLLDRLNDLIYANPTKFNRVDQLSTNSYIESYSNPTNWT